MPTPKYDRPELRPDGFKGTEGGTVPHPQKPQPQPTGAMPPLGTPVPGNNGR